MTDSEKLQQLFQAALQDSSSGKKPLTRAFPTTPAVVVQPIQMAPVPTSEPVQPAVIEASRAVAPLVEPMPNAGLDAATSAELGALLDAQIKRKSRKRRFELVATLVVFLGLSGGGLGWFVQSPSRVQALHEAVNDVRSLGDVQGLVAKYQVALDRVAARSNQIDSAMSEMGSDPSQASAEDPYLSTETEKVLGVEGQDIGERNKRLQESLGKVVKKPATAGEPSDKPADGAVATSATGDSFEWDK